MIENKNPSTYYVKRLLDFILLKQESKKYN